MATTDFDFDDEELNKELEEGVSFPPIKDLEFGCCICNERGESETMFELMLFVTSSNNEDIFQQWWAHPKCIKGVMHPVYSANAREEIEALWND